MRQPLAAASDSPRKEQESRGLEGSGQEKDQAHGKQACELTKKLRTQFNAAVFQPVARLVDGLDDLHRPLGPGEVDVAAHVVVQLGRGHDERQRAALHHRGVSAHAGTELHHLIVAHMGDHGRAVDQLGVGHRVGHHQRVEILLGFGQGDLAIGLHHHHPVGMGNRPLDRHGRDYGQHTDCT